MNRKNERPLPELSDTKRWSVSPGYRGLGEAVREWFQNETLAVVSDTVIWDRLGAGLEAALGREGLTLGKLELLPGEPMLHAEYRWIGRLVSAFTGSGHLLVSFGSGTVNDLVKRAAFELGKPYLSIATAPSVDGYSSYGAAILVDGFKQTLECAAPRVIFADPAVLASAPAEMIAAGYGDLASKLTAGSDWVLADAFGLDPIAPVPWSIVQDELRARLEAPAERLAESLFEGLLATGFAMQIMRSSRPVSGAEHLLSHVWEMENLEVNGRPVLHGNKVALGLLAATAFTEELRRLAAGTGRAFDDSGTFGTIPQAAERERELLALSEHLPSAAREELLRIALEKLPNPGTLRSRYAGKDIREICGRAAARLLPFPELRERLSAAGCPVEPSTVGIDRERFLRTIRLAQAMRNRFTVLDLAWELGLFEECAERTAARFVW